MQNGGNVTYTYGLTTEADTTPRLNSGNIHAADYDPGTTYYHLNLTAITDQNGHTCAFDYHLHYQNGFGDDTTGFQSYNDFGGYYPTPGRPLLVADVTLPTGFTSHFLNDSFVEVTGGGANLAVSGTRHTVVLDAGGNRTDYEWTNPSVMQQDIPSAIADESPDSSGELVAWGSLTLTHTQINGSSATTLGAETFTFDKSAGMALASITDFCGHQTLFYHADHWTLPAGYAEALPGIYDDSVNGYFGYYDDPTLQTNALGGNKTFRYNDARLLYEMLDENNRLTHYEFDGGGNLTLGLHTRELHYSGADANSTLIAETDYTYGNATFPTIVTQKTVVDLDSSHPAGPGNLTVAYDLDQYGRVSAQHLDPGGLNLTTSYTYSRAGDKLSETDPRGNVTHFSYDGRHRLVSVVYPNNSARSFAYDLRGNPVGETDENGHQTIRAYDALNRLTSSTRVMDGVNAPFSVTGNLITASAYSPTGTRISSTDPNRGITTMAYDALGRLVSVSSPSVLTNGNSTATPVTTTFAYDKSRNCGSGAFDSSAFKPTTTVDARGFITSVAYDPLYRPTALGAQYDSGGNAALVTKEYDPVGNLRFAHIFLNGSATGNLTADAVETTTMSYDALNRLVSATFADGSSVSANYTSTGFAWLLTDEARSPVEITI